MRKESTVTVRYGSEAFDPTTTDNTLSLAVLKSAAEEFSYQYELQQDRPNRVEIKIKTGDGRIKR